MAHKKMAHHGGHHSGHGSGDHPPAHKGHGFVGGHNGNAPGMGRHLQNNDAGPTPGACSAHEYFQGANEGMYGGDCDAGAGDPDD
jgi:hypothetical protein